VLKTDRPFRWFLFGRILFQFAMMSFAFYIVYCVKHLSMSSAMAGIMTSVLFITSVVANTLLGWIADKWSKRGVLELGAIAGVLSSILAFLAVDLNLFYLVFILNGISGVAFWTVGIAYTLDFGTEAERPTYVGMANTLIAPSAILAPLLGGWLADAYGYGTTFIVAAIAGMITVVVIHISGKK
ncbi:MAG: MFS transporter, partial [Anaerolineaceae bacterium]|nr:MFS transporter [Anaerolineaceae bacterium]